MSDAIRPGSDTRFFRRFGIALDGCMVTMEFDYGFLTSALTTSMHNHAVTEITCVVDGTLSVDSDEEPLLCPAASVLFMPRGVYHCNRPSDPTPRRYSFRCSVVKSRPGSIWQPLVQLLDTLDEPLILPIAALAEPLERIRDEFLRTPLASEEMVLALLRECCVILLRGITASDPQTPPAVSHADGGAERLKNIERFFSHRYAEQVSIADLASVLYLSPTQTNRILRAQYGQSFREKLRDTRLYRAKQLLETSSASAVDIAGDVGYSSVAAFFSAFRHAFGMTPAEYRRRVRER